MTTAPPTHVDGLDDAALARAAASGDRSAFAAIYDRYADRLHDFCVGMLRDRDAAADCVQDVFVTAATRLAQLREPDRLRSWLYAIARNEALARIRDRRREQPSEQLPEIASGEPDLETLAARSELADLISQACGGLSDRDRLVLELAYRRGLDGPELAEALGVTHKNANTLVERVRATIERSLGALLVCRRVKADPARCAELAGLTHHWDGQFTVLMRKRAARHIDSCPECDGDRARMVSPVALLGSVPVIVPAPAWLREQVLTQAAPVFPPSAAAPATHGSHPGSGTGAPAGPNDPSQGAELHTATDMSWWPPYDVDTTDLGDPAPPSHPGTAPHAPMPRRLGRRSASESASTGSSAAYVASKRDSDEPSLPIDRTPGSLRRHTRAALGVGLLSLGLGGAVLVATPAIYRVEPTLTPGAPVTPAPASITPMTTPLPTNNPGPTGPTVPTSATSSTAPSTIPGTAPTGPTVPTSATSSTAPSTIPGTAPTGPTVPSSTHDPDPTGPTVATALPPSSTTPPPTSQVPTKPSLGPTGLNPPSRQEPSDSTCPPNTPCSTDGPFR